jgi:uncharacterized membrane protein YuzA (DUF378 family)
MKILNVITLILVVVGAVNWGLVGLTQFDLVAALLGGSTSALARIVYTLVGLAGLYQILPLTNAIVTGEHNPDLAPRSAR